MAFDLDFFVIGAGSGGVRAARIASGHGAKTLVAEEGRVGGACVLRGCVPKKLYVHASRFADDFRDAAGFGWSVGEPTFDWPTLVKAKEKEISRLSDAYRENLARSGAKLVEQRATVVDPHRVRLADGREVSARHILIASGSRPVMPDWRRRARARDHLERDLRSARLSPPPSRHWRRLYRGRVRFAIPAPGLAGHDGHARSQPLARLRRGHAQGHARRDGECRNCLSLRLLADLDREKSPTVHCA